MDLGFVVSIFRTGIFQLLIVSSPPLIVGMMVGLIIAIFQATTSIQEQTLTFVPKIAAIFMTLVFFGPWMIQMIVQYTVTLFSQISRMVG